MAKLKSTATKLHELKHELKKHSSAEKAKLLQRFFKTGPGEYAEGDIFIGVMVPDTRRVAKAFLDLSLSEIAELTGSVIHEERLCGFIILNYQYEKASRMRDQKQMTNIYNTYMKQRRFLNNWDLVDVTVPKLVGAHLFRRSRAPLYKLAKSKSLWERRIAILATAYFIREQDFQDTIKISEILLEDRHDLIHKAVGWMLREVGKKNQKVLVDFIEKHKRNMPRTMLRYAIEKFSPRERAYYLNSSRG